VGHWHPIQLSSEFSRLAAVQVCFGGYGEWHAVLPPAQHASPSLARPGWSDSESASPGEHGPRSLCQCDTQLPSLKGRRRISMQQSNTDTYKCVHTYTYTYEHSILSHVLFKFVFIHAHTCTYSTYTCRYIPNTYTRTCAFIHTVLSMPLHVPLRLLDSLKLTAARGLITVAA
jgi:hypothetical protein